MEYFPRLVTPNLIRALTWSPVVLLSGPRQCGKTTLCKVLNRDSRLPFDYAYMSLDDVGLREFAVDDPVGFVDQLPPNVILDEVQLSPSIYRPIKMMVDERREPGRFLLAGSTQVALMGELAESLVGRMRMVQLYPLAQSEIGESESSDGTPRTTPFLSSVFDRNISATLTQVPRLAHDLANRIVAGGYPEARQLSTSDRRNWHRDYIRTIAYRDIKELTSIRRIDILPNLATVAAAHTAQLLNLAEVARHLDLSRTTVHEYTAIMQNLLILQFVPPWSNNRLKRTVQSPKLHFVDTGLACGLLDLDEDSLWSDRKRLGLMAESFVLQELVRQASWFDGTLGFYHYRDRDRTEVDIVVEKSGLGIVAIEVKIGATVKDLDFRGIRKLQQNSQNFIAGIVLYDGEWTRQFGDNLWAIPIARIWETREA
ncbi:MAG: ATP-binding protein [Gammaproteobacteria bacterium]|nr:ATP-binding protein [Gammaproteobacteria bacterium]